MDWEPRVGMRVVCLKVGEWVTDDGRVISKPGETCPQKGDVVTIRRVEHDPWESVPYLAFLEFPNPKTRVNWRGEMDERMFWAPRFRPLDERRLDIFRAVLTKAPTPEKEPA